MFVTACLSIIFFFFWVWALSFLEASGKTHKTRNAAKIGGVPESLIQ